MTFEEFDKLFDSLFADCQKMRDTKGKEYTKGSKDRLANFKDIANELGMTSLQVWSVYIKKHLRSIDSYIKNERTFSDENIRGRFIDAMTYLALGYGLIADQSEAYPRDYPIKKKMSAANDPRPR